MPEMLPDQVVFPNDVRESHYFEAKDRFELEKLSKINVFVGENNVGKSRLMRFVSSVSSYKKVFVGDEFGECVRFARDFWVRSFGEKDRGRVFYELVVASFDVDVFNSRWMNSMAWICLVRLILQDGDEWFLESSGKRFDFSAVLGRISLDGNVMANFSKLMGVSQEVVLGVNNSRNGVMYCTGDGLGSSRISSGSLSRLKSKFEDVARWVDSPTEKYYVPTLRGLRILGGEEPYKKRTESDYAELKKGQVIFTGHEFFKTLKEYLLGRPEKRARVTEYQQWLSRRFFKGQRVALTPREEGMDEETENRVHLMVGEREHPIEQWGDGTQAMIALTFLPYMKQRGPEHKGEDRYVQFYIEEPEVHLHPGLQRVLLDSWRDFDGVQIFMTTHSNHFLDMSTAHEDVSIYTFQRKEDGVAVSWKDRDALEAVRLLGARPSSVVLVNCTIWVEGPTDRETLVGLLELYQDWLAEREEVGLRLLEDLHYSFVFLGGSLISKLKWVAGDEGLDVEKVSKDVFFVSDSDGLFRVEDEENKGRWYEWKRESEGEYKQIVWDVVDGKFADLEGKAYASLVPADWESKAIPAKLTRHIKLQEKLKDRFGLLEVRELENLHPRDLLTAYFKITCSEATPLSVTDEELRVWYLGDVFREEMNRQAITDTGGRVWSDGDRSSEGKGTLSTLRKKELATFAVGYYRQQIFEEGGSWEEAVPLELRSLVEHLDAFIRKHN